MIMFYTKWQPFFLSHSVIKHDVSSFLFSNMMKEEKILAEERMEKRIEIYMHSVKKSHKRKRIFEDEDEGSVETVPGVFLQEEQAKVKVSDLLGLSGCILPGGLQLCSVYWFRAQFLSHAQSNLRLCSANHRPGYWSNLPCDWPSTAWAYF